MLISWKMPPEAYTSAGKSPLTLPAPSVSPSNPVCHTLGREVQESPVSCAAHHSIPKSHPAPPVEVAQSPVGLQDRGRLPVLRVPCFRTAGLCPQFDVLEGGGDSRSPAICSKHLTPTLAPGRCVLCQPSSWRRRGWHLEASAVRTNTLLSFSLGRWLK